MRRDKEKQKAKAKIFVAAVRETQKGEKKAEQQNNDLGEIVRNFPKLETPEMVLQIIIAITEEEEDTQNEAVSNDKKMKKKKKKNV